MGEGEGENPKTRTEEAAGTDSPGFAENEPIVDGSVDYLPDDVDANGEVDVPGGFAARLRGTLATMFDRKYEDHKNEETENVPREGEDGRKG